MLRFVLFFLFYLLFLTPVYAQEGQNLKNNVDPQTQNSTDKTPLGNFFVAPVLSNGPKLGFSAGLNVGYLHKLDEKSTDSIFMVTGKYSNTNSFVGGFFTKMFWDEDRQRLVAGFAEAQAKNDYSDFQGLGELNVTTTVKGAGLKYQHRIADSNWYMGPGFFIISNEPKGDDAYGEAVLDKLGFKQQTQVALSLVTSYDTRDNQYLTRTGSYFNSYLSRFDTAFGGDSDYNSFTFLYNNYNHLGGKHYLALNTSSIIVPDAPKTSQATLRRYRAYTTGEDSGEYSWIGQAEYRYQMFDRWALAGFAGVAFLIDDLDDLGDESSWYPMGGAGIRYILKPKQKIEMRLDFAVGKKDNHALYLQMGQPF